MDAAAMTKPKRKKCVVFKKNAEKLIGNPFFLYR
jgi:hypothetical protein